jgi:hypothetical protein
MDSIFTILLYVGALVLIGLVKSIGKAGKKKSAMATPMFSVVEEEKREESFDFNSIFNFLQENPVSPQNEVKPRKIKEAKSIVSAHSERDMLVKKSSDTHIALAERDDFFIFGDFNLPAAIVYSEILKRPDY